MSIDPLYLNMGGGRLRLSAIYDALALVDCDEVHCTPRMFVHIQQSEAAYEASQWSLDHAPARRSIFDLKPLVVKSAFDLACENSEAVDLTRMRFVGEAGEVWIIGISLNGSVDFVR